MQIVAGESASLPVMMYHAIHPRNSPISISPDLFKWQMDWLHTNGYRGISVGEFVHRIRQADSLPNRSIVLTFDDGFECLYNYAFPILSRYGFGATIFLVTGYCGRLNDWPGQPVNIPRLPMLSWAQIQEMDKGGIEFGAHTVNHPRLDQITLDEVEYEILTSKNEIENRLGHSIDQFAYPYGQYDHTIKAIVQEAYLGACSTRLGFAGLHTDPFEIERVDANFYKHVLVFQSLPGPLSVVYLTFRRLLRTTAAIFWKKQWR